MGTPDGKQILNYYHRFGPNVVHPNDYPVSVEPLNRADRDFGYRGIRVRRNGEVYPCDKELSIWMRKSTGNWWYVSPCPKCGSVHQLAKGYKDEHHFEFIICPVKMRKVYKFFSYDKFKPVDT